MNALHLHQLMEQKHHQNRDRLLVLVQLRLGLALWPDFRLLHCRSGVKSIRQIAACLWCG